jgi:hypothetical protein
VTKILIQLEPPSHKTCEVTLLWHHWRAGLLLVLVCTCVRQIKHAANLEKHVRVKNLLHLQYYFIPECSSLRLIFPSDLFQTSLLP